MMRRSIKLISLFLSLIILLSFAVSCNTGDSNTPESSSSDESTPTSSPTDAPSSDPDESTPAESPESSSEESTEGLEALIPPAMNLDCEMNIFAGTLYYDEWLDEDIGDLVGSEVYERIFRVEENLGIDLYVDRTKGDWTYRQTIMDEVKKRQESTDPNLIADLVSTYSVFAGSLTLEGRYQNINNSDNIDLSSPWWPDDLLENSTIDDKVYFVSGDISPTLIYETYAIFYNLDLIEKYNLENPIALVNANEWTIDKVIEMTSGIYEDVSNVVKGPSSGDFFAFNFNDNSHLKAFPFGMGVRVIVPDEDDGYAFSDNYTGQKMELIFDKVSTWIEVNPGVKTQSDFDDYGVSFKNGNCIFTVGNFAYAAQHLSGSGVDYGVVPCPMYDEFQGEYFSYYGNPTSFWGIPSNANIDNSCALLESLAADAYVHISPVLFERAIKIKYVTGEVEGLSHMFDIIRDGLVFDACMFYLLSINAHYNEFKALADGGSSWISQFNSFKLTAMRRDIEKLVTTLRQLDY